MIFTQHVTSENFLAQETEFIQFIFIYSSCIIMGDAMQDVSIISLFRRILWDEATALFICCVHRFFVVTHKKWFSVHQIVRFWYIEQFYGFYYPYS